MKILKIFFLFLLVSRIDCFAQNPPVYFLHLDSLPPQGVAIDKGWKFHGGDDTSWASTGLDDSKWQTVDLSNAKSYFSSFNKNAIGWFRIKIYVDSSTNNNQAAILLSQLGASDWFINGRLFIQFGRIIAPGKVENYNPHDKPILFPGNLGDSVLIAVRFASTASPKPWMFTRTNTAPITVKIAPWMNALSSYKAALVEPRMSIGYSFMSVGLGFLFILLYSFFPKERIHILFGAFCFFVGLMPVFNSQITEGSLDINSFNWTVFVMNTTSKMAGLLILCILALEITNKINIFQWAIIFLVLIVDGFLYVFFGESQAYRIFDISLRSLYTFELLRLCILAFWRANYTMGVVAFSGAFMNVAFVLSILNIISYTPFYNFFNSFLNFVIISIYLAIKYARNSRYLGIQLSEIQKLSRENMQREQEKQQMLATQNEKLEQQVEERTYKLNQSLNELQETQSQLIQSEKMASLGELTAGIAHEIQNPLNFVNNFSEVSMELADDLKNELGKIKIAPEDKENLESIANDLIQNQEKINHHGKRADGIVKGMLHHSRTSTGQKELTDINLLADEYLRLSYHGLRAKDKSFNATLRTDFDERVGKVNIVPQDIGRVLLNLFNNAFYAVTEKKESKTHSPGGYEPTVSVTTKLIPASGTKTAQVEIRVWDNGIGISQSIHDKIYQPFFTTKPTGKGTGLGLSLSYDIINKEHGGQITLDTKDGEFAEFIIRIPCNTN